jgi:hypothetical protein
VNATCTKCGKTKPASAFPLDSEKTNGLHSWCYECKRGAAKVRYHLDRALYGSEVPRNRRTAYRKPGWEPTALYKATPRKPFEEWTEAERAEWRRVLLAPERRAQ